MLCDAPVISHKKGLGMTLKVGDRAPAFHLPDQHGEKHRLADFKGDWVVIWFYPKANTPG